MHHDQVKNTKIGSLNQNSEYKGVKERKQAEKKQLRISSKSPACTLTKRRIKKLGPSIKIPNIRVSKRKSRVRKKQPRISSKSPTCTITKSRIKKLCLFIKIPSIRWSKRKIRFEKKWIRIRLKSLTCTITRLKIRNYESNRKIQQRSSVLGPFEN